MSATAEAQLCRTLQISPLMARLLIGRGLADPDQAHSFLSTRLEDIPDPHSLEEMDRAVARILQAIKQRDDVLIYGDYDVDGMTGTAQLALFLAEVGLTPRTFLPHRLEDGYGLNPKTLAKILAHPPDLLITIDNGTNAVAEISRLRSQGIDVMVIDHHETPNQRPDVVALLNPKSSGSTFKERNIASAGLVFLFLIALRQSLRQSGAALIPNLKRYLDLATLGTIADVVPLVGYNRTLVTFGLKELTETTRPGLIALKEVAQVVGPVTPTTVGFRLAPRLNAAGRMRHASLALQLLMTADHIEAKQIATQLEQLNQERQAVEEEMAREAYQMVELEASDRCGLVVAREGWHLGVAGIVAARLVDRYQKPAIVIALENGVGRGSGRTVPEISLYDALTNAASELIHFGGHHAACGLAIEPSRIAIFAKLFDQAVQKQSGGTSSPLWIDSFVELSHIDLPLIQEIARLEPFGAGNPEPLFAVQGVTIVQPRIVGTNHLKGIVQQGNTQLAAIGFRFADQLTNLSSGNKHNIAFSPQINEWKGSISVQLRIRYLQAPK